MPHDPRAIELIVVHHSATRPDATWRTIRRMHLGRFKLGIGYHRILERDGTTMDGRRIQVRGAHAPPNSNRFGLCVLGWNEAAVPALSRDAVKANWEPHWAWTETQWNTLIHRDLPYFCDLFPNAMICGHNQTKATLCPGVDLPSVLMQRGWLEPERLLNRHLGG
jgi:hypothetical protein